MRMSASFLVGLGAGAVIAAVTLALEHSRIAFGPKDAIALYGNGALARAGSRGRDFAVPR